MKTLSESERHLLNSAIREIPDFPEPGIVFRDITTLLNNAEAFSVLMNHLRERYQDSDLDFIAGIDARGFIFGAALAQMLNVGFVPVRKKGKLPYTTVSEKYVLEYGVDEVEIHIDAFLDVEQPRVLLVDDLIATGGTAYAAANLIRQSGGVCVEACFVMSLDGLGGKEKLQENTTVYHLL
jgi:adenine phosphoribosyltransferase